MVELLGGGDRTSVEAMASVYVAATEAESGKSAVSVGLLQQLTRRAGRVAVFRPVVRSFAEPDPLLELLVARSSAGVPYDASIGVTYDLLHEDPDRAIDDIVGRLRALERRCDVVLVVGTDFTDVGAPVELAFNAKVAVNIGASVIAVVRGSQRSPAEVVSAVDVGLESLRMAHAHVVAVVANRVDPHAVEEVAGLLTESVVGPATYVLPEEPMLAAPTVRQLQTACDARLLSGSEELLQREALHFTVAAMTVPNLLRHLTTESTVVVTPGDRSDVLLAVMAAHVSGAYPSLAGIVLTGGLEPPPEVTRLVEAWHGGLPVLLTEQDTYETATRMAHTRGPIEADSRRKIETATSLVDLHIDIGSLLARVELAPATVVTPLMFEHELLDRARADLRHIVLPEGEEQRVLTAADQLLRRKVAHLTLLGDEAQIRAKAATLGLDISAADVIDPHDPELRESFAEEYARLRGHKGMTVDLARDVVVDVSYFGTLMVHLGRADGMVSGAVHTTAHTIRPSFEIIRTQPGVSIVSSVFFMCLSDRVLVYGDCAVNPDPSAEQLADIAISSATTAERFGVEPRIAMLSYSTGDSGAGAEVDKVRAATALVRERRPDLEVEGPIQYDAAVDASVARTKLPESTVAGRASVFVFPDLNTGNNTYKAVQRSAAAVAIGPVLQGLNKPVNDLSRGATVEDIVHTVAITAVQAQAEERPPP